MALDGALFQKAKGEDNAFYYRKLKGNYSCLPALLETPRTLRSPPHSGFRKRTARTGLSVAVHHAGMIRLGHPAAMVDIPSRPLLLLLLLFCILAPLVISGLTDSHGTYFYFISPSHATPPSSCSTLPCPSMFCGNYPDVVQLK